MWIFRTRERFSLEELKHLNEQLSKYPVVTDANKEIVVETLRSMAELMIWGDQHEPAFFEYFMEKQVLVHFLRILKNSSKKTGVAVQLLQTLSIMIQNIRSEQAIYYMFSAEHINNLISFPFDFNDEEVLAYYISFLRTISMKLDEGTISFFIKTQPDGTISFPLYREAIKFVHHEEAMVRIAVRTLTLNVYNVQNDSVRKYVLGAGAPYFSDLVTFLRQQSHTLDSLVDDAAKQPMSNATSGRLEAGIAELGDLLFYCNDILQAGMSEVRELMTDHMLNILILPVLLPSLTPPGEECLHSSGGVGPVSPLCAMYLLSRVLHVVTYRPLLDGIISAILSTEGLSPRPRSASPTSGDAALAEQEAARRLSGSEAASSARSHSDRRGGGERLSSGSNGSTAGVANGIGAHLERTSGELNPPRTSRELILHYLVCGVDKLVLAGLCILVSLLQNTGQDGASDVHSAPGQQSIQAMDDTLLDALGILPRKKRHKQLLLQALVGSTSEEELKEIFAARPDLMEEDVALELRHFPKDTIDFSDLEKLKAAHAMKGGKSPSNGVSEEDYESYCTRCGGRLQNGFGGDGSTHRQQQQPWEKAHEEHANARTSQNGEESKSGGWRSWLTGARSKENYASDSPTGRCTCSTLGIGKNSKRNRKQVLDALMELLCRRPPQCTEALWHAGWLLQQLLPYADTHKLSDARLALLDGAYGLARSDVLRELEDCWVDALPAAVSEEWKICKKALETPSLQKDSSFVLMSSSRLIFPPGDTSSGAVGERMRISVKVFVALHQMRSLLLGRDVPDVAPLGEALPPAPEARTNNRKGLDTPNPSEGNEVQLLPRNAIPCKVAFERGKERAVFLVATAFGTTGALLLAEGIPNEISRGIVRVAAPLAGCTPRRDEKHPRWLHLRIRSPHQPSAEAGTMGSQSNFTSERDRAIRMRRLADGRWTLSFADEAHCQMALRAVLEEIAIQANASRQILEPLLGAAGGKSADSEPSPLATA